MNYELVAKWDDFFERVNDYATTDAKIDTKTFAALIFETVVAINEVLDNVYAIDKNSLESFLELFGLMKAYSMYPTIVEDENTVYYKASQILVKDILVCTTDAISLNRKIDVSNFFIYFCDLPDSYDKDEYDRSKIPFDFETGDLTSLVQALIDGGYYDE